MTARRTVTNISSIVLTFLLVAIASADVPKTVQFSIVKAIYGDIDNDKTIDVTAKVAALAKGDSLTVLANNAMLGDPGVVMRKLKVSYLIDGVWMTRTVDEGETLDISTRLEIRKATYGDLAGGKTADVTEIVAGMVRHNTLSVTASNDAMGGDPAGNVVKKLKVDYTFDGVEKSKTVAENDTLTISAKGE